MDYHKSKLSMIRGSQYSEVVKQARGLHTSIAAKSKRRPYIRSKYFNSDKVFISKFWDHLGQKSKSDRKRRLLYYPCAIDLIANTSQKPTISINPNGNGNRLFRFFGSDNTGNRFVVQIYEDRRTKNKYFISVFPEK